MLQELKSIFASNLKEKGEAFIADTYVLSPGTYLVVQPDSTIRRYEINSKSDNNDSGYRFLAERDRLSVLLAMNKPIDSKKVIHSNQLYAFFVKKDSLSLKLTDKVIDDYYALLLNPRDKYKDKKKRQLYEEVEEKSGKLVEEEVLEIKGKVKGILTEFASEEKLDKSYLKIFFDVPLERYRQEQEKYIIPNIYNTNDYNLSIDERTYGVPNNNFGMNAKKPYLENKSRKHIIPVLLDSEDVFLQHRLFEFLSSKASAGYRNVYFDEESKKIVAVKAGDLPVNLGNGYYIYLEKGIEVAIQDFDTYTGLTDKIHFVMHNYLDFEVKQDEFQSWYGTSGKVEELKTLQARVNRIFFQNQLVYNYFTEPSDIRIYEPELKEALLRYRKAFHAWFYKGKSQLVRSLLPTCALELIESSIMEEHYFLARHQYNLYLSLQNHFSTGGKEMPDLYSQYIDELQEKIRAKETSSFASDGAFYIAAGQAAYYLLSLSKASKPPAGLKKALLRAHTHKKLKAELLKLYDRYFYAIDEKHDRRFNQLMAMVAGFEPETPKVNREALLYGYLHNNILYMPTKKEQEEKVAGGME